MPRTKNKRKKLHVKKGDEVRVIAGNSRGLEGKVLRVFSRKERVIVEGVNLRWHHEKPTPTNPQGGRMEKEAPIHVSNVMPLDGEGRPTRVGRKRIDSPDTGKSRWVRYAKTTGNEMDQ